MNKPFYQLIEKQGDRRGVYSFADYEYMVRVGWKPVNLQPPQEEPKPEVKQDSSALQIPTFIGRPRKT